MNLSKPYERSHPKKYDALIEKREKYILLDVKKINRMIKVLQNWFNCIPISFIYLQIPRTFRYLSHNTICLHTNWFSIYKYLLEIFVIVRYSYFHFKGKPNVWCQWTRSISEFQGWVDIYKCFCCEKIRLCSFRLPCKYSIVVVNFSFEKNLVHVYIILLCLFKNCVMLLKRLGHRKDKR